MAGNGSNFCVGFPPICRADARVLVLGSLPGRRSLETGQYYAHPRNAFWPIMRGLVGAAGGYEQRCRRLMEAGVALWDVLKAADRRGSVDAKISLKDAQVNDFHEFFFRHSAIRCIGFNGKTAESLFLKRVVPSLGLELPQAFGLPSSSPAHAVLSVSEKREIWRSILGPSLGALSSKETRP